MANAANTSLAIENVITVSISSPGITLGSPNMSAVAFITENLAPGSWSSGQTYAIYKSPSAVATDWGASSDLYNMAVAMFSQSPNILTGGGYLTIIAAEAGETHLETLQRIKGDVYFAGFTIDTDLDAATAELIALADYGQSEGIIFGYTSKSAAMLESGSALDQFRTRSDTYARAFYYGDILTNGQAQIFSAAYLGRAMSIDFSGVNTVLSMNLQSLSTINPDQTIDETMWIKAQAAGIDIYASISGVPSVLSTGANLYFDQIYCRAWLGFALEVQGFNYLKSAAGVAGKIPQTEEGMAGLRDSYTKVIIQGVRNGYMAPGAWNLPVTFGDPEDFLENVKSFGYYIVSAPVADQLKTDRDARKAPLIQIAIKEAGAIHSSSVLVQVNA